MELAASYVNGHDVFSEVGLKGRLVKAHFAAFQTNMRISSSC
jgi:hypothetical protein